MKFNNRKGLWVVLLLGITAITCKQAETQTDEGIQFETISYEEALKKAGETGKLVFLDAYASWCGPCKFMSRKVFTQQDVGEFYNKNFINLKIDMEKGEGPSISRKLGVQAYPSLFFLDKDGNVVEKNIGALDGPKMIKFGEKALSLKS